MITDIKINWDEDLFEGDIEFLTGDLRQEIGLTTAVYMSLFTDRRASSDETLPDPNSKDRKGWWGDALSEYNNDNIGSLLWLLSRAKTINDVLVKAKAYTSDALAWMVIDGIASKVAVEVLRKDRKDKSSILSIAIAIHKADGTKEAISFDLLWENQFAGG